MLAVTSRDEINVYNVVEKSVEVIQTTRLQGELQSVNWNHTNQVLATPNANGKIYLTHSTTGQLLSVIPFEETQEQANGFHNSISFSSNSRHIAQSFESTILIWDLKKKCIRNQLRNSHQHTITSLSFFSDGRLASGDTNGDIYVWDLKSNESIITNSIKLNTTTTISNQCITCLKSNITGTPRIATCTSAGYISVYDLTTMTSIRTQQIHNDYISALSFSPKNSRLIASCSYDGRVCLTDTHSKTTEPTASITINGEKLSSVSFHENAIHTAVSDMRGRVYIYDWRNVKQPIVVWNASKDQPITAISFQNPAVAGSTNGSVHTAASNSINTKTTTPSLVINDSLPPSSSTSDMNNLNSNSNGHNMEIIINTTISKENIIPTANTTNTYQPNTSYNSDIGNKDMSNTIRSSTMNPSIVIKSSIEPISQLSIQSEMMNSAPNNMKVESNSKKVAPSSSSLLQSKMNTNTNTNSSNTNNDIATSNSKSISDKSVKVPMNTSIIDTKNDVNKLSMKTLNQGSIKNNPINLSSNVTTMSTKSILSKEGIKNTTTNTTTTINNNNNNNNNNFHAHTSIQPNTSNQNSSSSNNGNSDSSNKVTLQNPVNVSMNVMPFNANENGSNAYIKQPSSINPVLTTSSSSSSSSSNIALVKNTTMNIPTTQSSINYTTTLTSSQPKTIQSSQSLNSTVPPSSVTTTTTTNNNNNNNNNNNVTNNTSTLIAHHYDSNTTAPLSSSFSYNIPPSTSSVPPSSSLQSQTQTQTKSNSFIQLKQSLQPVTHIELQEELKILKYDIHKEIQVILNEQNKLFEYNKEDMMSMMKDFSQLLKELLEANQQLRLENEKLRRIY